MPIDGHATVGDAEPAPTGMPPRATRRHQAGRRPRPRTGFGACSGGLQSNHLSCAAHASHIPHPVLIPHPAVVPQSAAGNIRDLARLGQSCGGMFRHQAQCSAPVPAPHCPHVFCHLLQTQATGLVAALRRARHTWPCRPGPAGGSCLMRWHQPGQRQARPIQTTD